MKLYAIARRVTVATAIIVATVLSASATTYKVLHDFTGGQDGEFLTWGVSQDSQGNLFGTAGGGESQGGVVFELSPNNDGTWTETIVHNFDFNYEGTGPVSGVTLDRNGSIYGSTVDGGPNGAGTVFQLSPGPQGWEISILYSQNGAAHMVFDAAGSLYSPLGPGDYKRGAIAKLSPSPSGWTYTALHSFCQWPLCPDGLQALAPLAWDAAGNLYGTTFHGGIYPYLHWCADDQGCGVAFQMKPRPDGTWAYRVLHWFGAFIGDGALLNGGLVVDSQGNVYGSVGFGGPTLTGAVFKLSPKPPGQWAEAIGYAETQLYTFPDCSQGCGPWGPLVMDQAGNLYGAAGGGNQSCNGYCGVIYRLAPQPDGTWQYTALHKFSGPDGHGPNGVTVGADGNLYGTTIAGGQYNRGVAFQITP